MGRTEMTLEATVNSSPTTIAELVGHRTTETFALLDEESKREIRRALLQAVCIPGYQVPFGSREMPVARGWGSGGLQVTLACVGADDAVKVIDQGDDEGVNAVNLRRLVTMSTGIDETTEVDEATLIQSRHRIPEDDMNENHILILQVPVPEPLRGIERDIRELARMHSEADYSRMWVSLYEDKVRNGVITQSTGYPCLVASRYIVATTPIPRWDIPRLHQSKFLTLFGAGREKRVYAIPPYTDVEPLTFEDVPFEVESADGATCRLCGSSESFLVEMPGKQESWSCSDTAWCRRQRNT
ncbi:MAG: alpha-D-ribose 1-methylphosphonate 5-phosphate C-P-lyase PhnJ [Actinomycetes bacterium]